MMPRPVLLGASIVLALVASRTSQAGPITFLTALPVSKGQAIVRGQYLLTRGGDDPTPMGRNLTVHAVPVAVAVGVTPRLALFGVVTYFDKSLKLSTPTGRVRRAVSGVGDVLVFGRYTAFAADRAGSTFRVAPFGGVKLPTAGDGASDRLGRLPRPVQLGSGSWDGLGGVAVSWQTQQWELDADAAYRRNTQADRFRFGKEASADVSLQYRLWPGRLGAGVPGFLYGVVESNLVSQARNNVEGAEDPNSGGTTWGLDLGVQYVTARYVLEGVVQIPLVQRLNGSALETGYRITAGLRWNFSLPF